MTTEHIKATFSTLGVLVFGNFSDSPKTMNTSVIRFFYNIYLHSIFYSSRIF